MSYNRYDSQYCFKEDEECPLQSSHLIRYLVKLNKPFEYGYWFKSHCLSINGSFSTLQGFHQYKIKNGK